MQRGFRILVVTLLALNLVPPVTSAQEAVAIEKTAITPAERKGSALKLHESILERRKQGKIDLVFLGDSITQGWHNNEVWKRYYAPRNAANFGIGGDRTQHVLWRLDHGEIDGISPKVVVLMIGTNNMNSNTPEEIAEGVRAIVDKLRSKLPETKILLLGVFPRGQKPAPIRDRIADLNSRIAKFDDGKTIQYLDINQAFLSPDGTISRDVMPDFLHLTPLGYERWAEAMEPTLWKMLEDD